MSGTRAISTSRRELSLSFFFFIQGKAPKEIQAILTETLACFLPGRAKDLWALPVVGMWRNQLQIFVYGVTCRSKALFAKLRKATLGFVNSLHSSVPSARNSSAPTRRIFMKFDVWVFFRQSVEKISSVVKTRQAIWHFPRRPIYFFSSDVRISLGFS
jgi:hypothetical protein